MKTNSEQFDAEMLIIGDRAIDAENPLFVSLIDSTGKSRTVVGQLILELLSLLEEIKTLASVKRLSKNTQALFHTKILQLNSIQSTLFQEKLLDKRLLEVLVDGRVKVALWLDSIGGSVEIEDKVNWSLDYLDRQDTTVESYVITKAASAAFDLAFLADKIHSMEKSVFMWHLSDSDEDPRDPKVKLLKKLGTLEPDVSEEIEDLFCVFDKAKPTERVGLVQNATRQFMNPRNPEGAIYFEGKYLAKMGMLSAHQKVETLIDQFNKSFPLHADKNVAFFTQNIAKLVGKCLSKEKDWFNGRALKATGKQISRLERVS